MMSAIANRMTKKDKRGRNHGGGYPKFKPSEAQRQAVRIMSGVKMTVDEMRKVILNPVTGLPLTRAAMYRYFRAEMDEGPPALKQLIAEKYMAHLREGGEYAVRLGLKNRHGWATEGAVPPPAIVGDATEPTIKVSFVLPDKRPEPLLPPPVIDAVPTKQPNYDLKAIEGPRTRERTPFGAVYEQPKGADSAFGQPRDPKSWMR
jgi:hypothetical protein